MKRALVLALLLSACREKPPANPNARPEADPLAAECLEGRHGPNGTYCSSAATFYELGDPAKIDLPKSLQMWKLACAAHEPHANGPEWPCLGVVRVGCKLGNASDCLELGRRQFAGSGGAARDPKAARRAFANACDAVVSEGCQQAEALRDGGTL